MAHLKKKDISNPEFRQSSDVTFTKPRVRNMCVFPEREASQRKLIFRIRNLGPENEMRLSNGPSLVDRQLRQRRLHHPASVYPDAEAHTDDAAGKTVNYGCDDSVKV